MLTFAYVMTLPVLMLKADLFNAKDLGVFKEGKFVSAEGIAPHGVLMLKLVYEPQYKTEL